MARVELERWMQVAQTVQSFGELADRRYLQATGALVAVHLTQLTSFERAQAELEENESEREAKRPRRYFKHKPSSESIWQHEYLDDALGIYMNARRGSTEDIEFRHRARMTRSQFEAFYDAVKKWFPDFNNDMCHVDQRKRKKHSLKLLLMASLAVLGGVISSRVIKDCTGIPKGTFDKFFKRFVKIGANEMRKEWITDPMSAEALSTERLKELTRPYTMAGLPGAIGSIDGVRVKLMKASYSRRHLHVGKEGFPTLTFLVAVSNDGMILDVSNAFEGRSPDISICRNWPFLSRVETEEVFTRFEWDYFSASGTKDTESGAWVLAHNGFPLDKKHIICPAKLPSPQEQKISEMLESMRKDVERVFGILKQRFLILKQGLWNEKMEYAQHVFHTCCAIHNFLLRQADRDLESIDIHDLEDLDKRLYRRISTYSEEPIARMRFVDDGRPKTAAQVRRAKLMKHFDYCLANNQVFWPRAVSSNNSNTSS